VRIPGPDHQLLQVGRSVFGLMVCEAAYALILRIPGADV